MTMASSDPAILGIPRLETERLVLRGPMARDWPLWRDFSASGRARHIGGPFDEPKAWRAFCHVIGMWVARGFGLFVVTRKTDDTAIGMTGPWYPIEWPEPEIGWTLWSPDAEGKGYAFEAAAAARRHAYGVLGWTTAVSYIAPANVRSIALAERLGATLDRDATAPNDASDLVYRHPGPEVAA
jgi:RimJ/RimL family protein N-acetyltransferase